MFSFISVHELLIDLLHQVNRKLGEKGREVFAQHKFPITTMIIAKHISLEPDISISELARSTNIAKSHVSNIIKDLYGRGRHRELMESCAVYREIVYSQLSEEELA